MENSAKAFLRYIADAIWLNIIDGGGQYLYRDLFGSVRELIRTYEHGFNGSSDLVVDSLAQRIKAEFEPMLTKGRILLDVEKKEIDMDGLVNEIYEANKEFWDGIFP